MLSAMTTLVLILAIALIAALSAGLLRVVRADGLGHRSPPRSHRADLFDPYRQT